MWSKKKVIIIITIKKKLAALAVLLHWSGRSPGPCAYHETWHSEPLGLHGSPSPQSNLLWPQQPRTSETENHRTHLTQGQRAPCSRSWHSVCLHKPCWLGPGSVVGAATGHPSSTTVHSPQSTEPASESLSPSLHARFKGQLDAVLLNALWRQIAFSLLLEPSPNELPGCSPRSLPWGCALPVVLPSTSPVQSPTFI